MTPRTAEQVMLRYRHHMRTYITMLVALVLLVVGCSSTSDTTTTVPDRTLVLGLDAEAMCRTLDLMVAGGVPAPQAAAAMLDVDLAQATSTERVGYGDLLAASPQEACPEHRLYAEDVTYWLGF
jgi:nitrous oxide reductase accessory protein NosL